jgi:glycolate oxidase
MVGTADQRFFWKWTRWDSIITFVACPDRAHGLVCEKVGDSMNLDKDLAQIVGAELVFVGEAISEDYQHDEALTVTWKAPDVVVKPRTTDEVAALMRLANDRRVPVTARGSGTGLSGSCVAKKGGILLSTERMTEIREIDHDNHVAVLQPGVTLEKLEEAVMPHGLVYPILPGESSATIGGNVATNAGGMRAVKYGVTRNNVLGMEAVLPTGEVIRSGGKFVKSSTGLDLTQLIIGSEGVLAIVTEVTVKILPRFTERAVLLLPFESVEVVMQAVPRIIQSGAGPLMLEYIDLITMAAITQENKLELGIPAAVQEKALAYLVVLLESRTAARLEEDVKFVGELASELGAIDVYLPSLGAGRKLLEAREKAFWMARKAGANDIIDIVVPRAAMPAYMNKARELAEANGTLIAGCGHAGDGNIHLSVFQPDSKVRSTVTRELFSIGMKMGGVISAEHGIGSEKQSYFLELEDPAKVALMRRIKAAFDPNGILNPGTVFG